MENKLNFRNMASEKNLDEEINLGNFFSFILRNIRFIGKLTFFTFIIACLYSFTLKKIWEGQFQIVLNLNENPQVNSVIEHPKEGLKAHIVTEESPENISKVLSPYTVGWELMK